MIWRLQTLCLLQSAGINGLTVGNLSGVQAIYDAKGRRLSKAQRGVSIFLMSDGTKRKVIVK